VYKNGFLELPDGPSPPPPVPSLLLLGEEPPPAAELLLLPCATTVLTLAQYLLLRRCLKTPGAQNCVWVNAIIIELVQVIFVFEENQSCSN
jgi:hypothetical protein